ncbi:MAG: hypothetical protein IJ668_07485 [Selenomonadaceae bacterium]|nr:hypothetical protein [Selenomonadaceae bacterium]
MELKLSTLRKTWIFDLDGTLVVHNGYREDGDRLLPGVAEFFQTIPAEDFILILTARPKEYADMTIEFLKSAGIRYNEIMFDIPVGERLLFNDDKPWGWVASYAVRLKRNEGLSDVHVTIEENL